MNNVSGVDEAVRSEAAQGRRVVVVGPAGTASALYDEFAQKLHFPPHFGHNLDALYDCLLDYALALDESVTIIWRSQPSGRDVDQEEISGILDDVENFASSGKGKTVPFRALVL